MLLNSGFSEIVDVVENVLGKSRRDPMFDGWTEYNCPYCTDENAGRVDNKYNCCVNYASGVFHCWKCGNSGRLSKIIKTYGGNSKLEEYRRIIKDIKSSQQYSLNDKALFNDVELLKSENTLFLPKDYKPLWNTTSKYANEALEYLSKRGINQDIIRKHHIGYVGYWSKDFKMRNRIIIPSYDEFGELNYFIARDYSGKQTKLKYNNPQVPKTSYIFDEGLVNWYEDITLVEGVFDHIVIPNSIPLLGKKLGKDDAVYKALVNKAMANVNVLLDDDAIKDAKELYYKLEESPLKGRVRIIECPNGYDASLVYQEYGVEGVKRLMKSKRKLDDFERIF